MAETVEQSKALAAALDAAANCRSRAKKCGQLGLTVLAREYDYFARSMEERVEWQRRALNPLPGWIDGASTGDRIDGSSSNSTETSKPGPVDRQGGAVPGNLQDDPVEAGR